MGTATCMATEMHANMPCICVFIKGPGSAEISAKHAATGSILSDELSTCMLALRSNQTKEYLSSGAL